MVALHGVMFASWRGSVLRRVDWRQLLAARRNGRSFLPVHHRRPRHLDRLPDRCRVPGHAEPCLRFGRVERALEFVRRDRRRRLDACGRNAVRGYRHHHRLDLRRRHGRPRHRRGRAARQGDKRRRGAGRGPHRARRQEGPRRQGDAGRAAQGLQCRLGVQAHLDAAAFDARQETGDGLRRARDQRQGNPDRRGVPRPRGPQARSAAAAGARRARQQRQGRRAGDRLRAGRAGLCRGLALRDAAQGRHRRQRPLHSADGRGRP